MSKNRYSEEEAVQKPAGELLTKLGWDIQCCFDEEKLGLYGTLGRESYHDVLLRRDLESALTELNEWMDEADVAEAIKTLEHTFVGDSLLPDQRGQVQHPARRHSRTQAGRGWHAPHRACANISLHNPLRIVFVCAMWLTGFDVKPLSVMYFDKPMKAHGLMQAIARQSRGRGQEQRPYRGLRGVVKALRQALADYTRDLGDDRDPVDVVVGKDELIRRIGELTGQITSFMSDRGFEVETLLAADSFGKLEAIQDAADAMFPPGASSDMQEAITAHFVRRGLLASCGMRREGWRAAYWARVVRG